MHKNTVVYQHPVVGEIWIAPGSTSFETYNEMSKAKNPTTKQALKVVLDKEIAESYTKSGMRNPMR